MCTKSVCRAGLTALVSVVCGILALAALGLWSGRADAQAAPGVSAGDTVAAGTATPVAVLDFVNSSAFGGSALGRSAADTLALAMKESNKFDPVKRSEVEQNVARLGFGAPLTTSAQGRLGTVLEIPYVVSGAIADLHFEDGSTGRIAVAGITVALYSVAAGDYVNGARVTRSSTPKPGFSGDDAALADEALSLATYDAVRVMISYTYPEATVLWGSPTEVVLSGGSQGGLKPGMELVIMRLKDKVGRVMVASVDARSANCTVLANYRGISPGDVAIPVFDASNGSGTVAVARVRHSRSGLEKALIAIGASAGIYFFQMQKGQGDTAVPNVRASSYTDPTGQQAGILVTWSPPAHQWRQVNLYEIWRDSYMVGVVNGPGLGGATSHGGQFFFFDTLAFATQYGTITLDIDADTGMVSGYTLTYSTDEPTDFGDGPLSQSYNRVFIVDPPDPGTSHIYRVVAIVTDTRVTDTSGTSTTTEAYLKESPFTGPSSLATCIAPVGIVSPAAAEMVADATAVDFRWTGVDAATDYILQISRDATFSELTSKTYTAHTGTVPDGTTLNLTVDVTTDFPQASGSATSLFWRIGTRNSADVVAPRTDPGLWSSLPQDQDWVWSYPGVNSFQIPALSSARATSRQPGSRGRWLGPRP